MADSLLRDAERRWRASRSLENEVAYLQARLRAGHLERARLELADSGPMSARRSQSNTPRW